jgi:uncharacterized membrane protein YdbT with pleckstrin-like domain
MALIKCQECGREVSDQAEACPHCGHPAPEGGASETILHDVAPSMIWTHPIKSLIAILLILTGITVLVLSMAAPAILGGVSPDMAIIGGVLLLAIGFIAMFVIWLMCRSVQLTVTNRRSTLRKGLISKQTTEVLHRDVRNIQVDQSFLQRMVGIGSLSISSAGQADLEIQIDGIHDPEAIARTVRTYQ